MNYVTTDTVEVVFTIPRGETRNTANQYHLEMHHSKSNSRVLVNAPTVVAATAVVDDQATFSGMPVAEDGLYSIRALYADGADLDAATQGLALMGRGTIPKVSPLASVAI